jgi:hypothetical protein
MIFGEYIPTRLAMQLATKRTETPNENCFVVIPTNPVMSSIAEQTIDKQIPFVCRSV